MSDKTALAPTALALLPRNFDDALRLAELMCRSKMVPQHLQSDPGACFLAIEQAMRWGMSPFAVAQCTSSIKGKLMYEGKIIHAAVESSKELASRLEHRFEGEGETRAIVVWATRRGDDSPREVRVPLTQARTANEWWQKQPDQMLVYFGARYWARRYTPAVLLGVYGPDEFVGTTIDGEASEPEPTSGNGTPTAPEPPASTAVPSGSNGAPVDPWDSWLDTQEAFVKTASADRLRRWLAWDKLAENVAAPKSPQAEDRLAGLMVLAEVRAGEQEAAAITKQAEYAVHGPAYED